MKKVIVLLIMFFYCIKTNGQTILKETFYFENKKISYSTTDSHKKGEINFIIKEAVTDSVKFYSGITKCMRIKTAPNYPTYIFIIPKEFLNKKEEIVLEFISYVLSKKKLIDMKTNIFSDNDYTKLYEETRIKNKGKYKNSFLNKIDKMIILKTNDNLCNLLK